jgi:hypothetical protein
MKLYVDCCTKLSEAPNMKLLTKLYNLEVNISDMYDLYLNDTVTKKVLLTLPNMHVFYFLTGL